MANSKIAHVLVSYGAAPWQRMLRFENGVPEIVDFPVIAARLTMAGWSPSGKYMIAAVDSGGVTGLHLWTYDGEFHYVKKLLDYPKQWPIPAIEWFTDRHVAVACYEAASSLDRGRYYYIFDEVAQTLTQAYFATAASATIVGRISDTHMIGAGLNVNATQLIERTGDTFAEMSVGINIVGALALMYRGDDNVLHLRNATTSNSQHWLSTVLDIPGRASTALSNTGSIGTSESVAGLDKRAVASPDQSLMLTVQHPGSANSQLTLTKNTKYVAGVNTKAPVFMMPLPLLIPAVPVGVAAVDDYAFIYASASAALPNGRVRGLRVAEDNTFTEMADVAALFADLNLAPINLVGSPVIEQAASSSVAYNVAVPAAVNGTVSLSNVKIALLDAAAVFRAGDTTLAAALGSNEVTGSSWPAGGVLTNPVTVETPGNGSVYWNITFPGTVLTTPGTLTFKKAVLYDDAHPDKMPLLFIELPEAVTAEQGDRIDFSATGNRFIHFGQGVVS